MADRKEIHEFAVTWQEKFINEDSSFWELSSAIFSDACLAFGFADAGRIVVAQGQPLAAVDREALRKSLAAVTDVTLIVQPFIPYGVPGLVMKRPLWPGKTGSGWPWHWNGWLP